MDAAEQSPRREQDAAARRDELLALGAALVTVAFWASAFVGIRDAGEELSPGALALARLSVGSAVLGAVVVARRERRPARRDLPGLLLCGVLWFGIYSVALNAAEQRVDAGTAAMLVNIGPILIILLAGLVLREGFPRNLVGGAAIASAGVVVIAAADSQRGVSVLGTLLCLAAAVAYAGGVVSQKPVLARVSPLQATFVCCLVGTLVCAPFAPQLAGEVGDARISALGWAVYLGVFPTALAFTTWAFALARTDAGRLGTTTYLVPPLSILMGWAFLGESPAVLAFAGGALCLAGVAIARGAGGALRRRGKFSAQSPTGRSSSAER
jgi:drug/metabolite transporter (DMT)-like permease